MAYNEEEVTAVGADKWHMTRFIDARGGWCMGLAWSTTTISQWRVRVVEKVRGRGQGGAVPGGELCQPERSLSGCLLSVGC
jgi:hypothetical protein